MTDNYKINLLSPTLSIFRFLQVEQNKTTAEETGEAAATVSWSGWANPDFFNPVVFETGVPVRIIFMAETENHTFFIVGRDGRDGKNNTVERK